MNESLIAAQKQFLATLNPDGTEKPTRTQAATPRRQGQERPLTPEPRPTLTPEAEARRANNGLTAMQVRELQVQLRAQRERALEGAQWPPSIAEAAERAHREPLQVNRLRAPDNAPPSRQYTYRYSPQYLHTPERVVIDDPVTPLNAGSPRPLIEHFFDRYRAEAERSAQTLFAQEYLCNPEPTAVANEPRRDDRADAGRFGTAVENFRTAAAQRTADFHDTLIYEAMRLNPLPGRGR